MRLTGWDNVAMMVFALMFVGQFAHADTLYGMLVSTSSLEGSGATDISNGAEAGLNLADEALDDIATRSGMSYSRHIIKADGFVSLKIYNMIADIHPGGDDVIFFYYSGHGVHASTDADRFPSMYVATSRPNIYGAIQETYVRGLLLKKHARLVITLFDSCNSMTDEFPQNPNFATRPALADTDLVRTSLQGLLDTRGFITIASAKAGTEAWIVPHKGGVFTKQFFTILTANIQAGVTDWSMLLKRTTNPIKVSSQMQTPIFEVEIKKWAQ